MREWGSVIVVMFAGWLVVKASKEVDALDFGLKAWFYVAEHIVMMW